MHGQSFMNYGNGPDGLETLALPQEPVPIRLNNSAGYVFDLDRAITQRNDFEMVDSSAGIEFLEDNASENHGYKRLGIRGNIIQLNGSMSSILSCQGIVFEAGANVICENNVVNVQNNNDSVIRRHGKALQVFNTRRRSARFVQEDNPTTGLLEQELTTNGEIYLFGL